MAEPRRSRTRDDERNALEERVVAINRVAKVVKGGRRFSFTALVVVGDTRGQVGIGYGKAKEVPTAIQKGIEEAKRNFFEVPMAGSTITHEVVGHAGAGRVLLKPASLGTGVIAGGVVRAILDCAGVRDVLAKSLGTSNAINVAHATVKALKSLRRPDEIARLRGKDPEEVAPLRLLQAYRETEAERARMRARETQMPEVDEGSTDYGSAPPDGPALTQTVESNRAPDAEKSDTPAKVTEGATDG